MSYIINYFKHEIAIYLVDENGEKKALKCKGEAVQTYCSKNFWQWFKDKINYENEALSFIVFSDEASFEIDETIAIATKNSLEALVKKGKIDVIENATVLTYPHIEDFKEIRVVLEEEERVEKREMPISEVTNLEDFFKQKTQGFNKR